LELGESRRHAPVGKPPKSIFERLFALGIGVCDLLRQPLSMVDAADNSGKAKFLLT
jgi:hypothetical protein